MSNVIMQQWFSNIRNDERFCDRWCSSDELYDDFNKSNSNTIVVDMTYQSFLKQLNIMQTTSNYNILKEITRKYGTVREYKYYIIYNNNIRQSNQPRTRSSPKDIPIYQQTNRSTSTHDGQCVPITPIEIRQNGNINTISHVSKMSV